MSTAFRFLVGARDKLYERGVLPTYRLNHPVISVGNLTVGGTGKTPLVILLAEQLRAEGFRPVVLSRGYRRKSSGTVIVSAGQGPLVSWDTAGDEPYVIARRTNAAVVVGADRYRAGLLAEEKNLGNLFILDDGFQHRRLHRNVDLVTIDPAEWIAGERLLPSGHWREPKEALARAHAAIVHKHAVTPQLPVPVFGIHTVVEGIYRNDEPVSLETLKNRAVTAFAGIAKPDRFFASLESIGVTLSRRIRFPDHHRYNAQELEALPGEIYITTEKDAVRLEGTALQRTGGFLHLRISVNIPDIERLLALIHIRLRERP